MEIYKYTFWGQTLLYTLPDFALVAHQLNILGRTVICSVIKISENTITRNISVNVTTIYHCNEVYTVSKCAIFTHPHDTASTIAIQ